MMNIYDDYKQVMLNELERVYQYINNNWFDEAEINNNEKYKSINLYYTGTARSNTEIYIKNDNIIVEHTLSKDGGSIASLSIECKIDDDITSKVEIIEEMINKYNADTERQAESERAYLKKLYGRC